ncbi:MAG: hypothetical protein ACOH2E_05245 [Candidatus Paracaedibacter sp.]
MKKIGLFTCGILLSVSPTFSLDECLYNIDSFLTGKFIFWTESNDEKPQVKHLPVVKANLNLIDPAYNFKMKQELSLSVNPPNNNVTAHFVGDAYGWCIAYY